MAHNATLGRRDFYRQICLALGVHPKATAAAVFYEVTRHLEQLSRRHQRSLYSRIQHRLQIESTGPEDTAEYIRHRLRLVGADREIFTDDAIATLHEASAISIDSLEPHCATPAAARRSSSNATPSCT